MAIQLTPVCIKINDDKVSAIILKASSREDAIRKSKFIEIIYDS